MPMELVRRLEELAFQYGRSYDSYLVTEPYWTCFFTADHSGAVCFVRWFGYHSVGGLLCDEGAKPALLDSFLDFCSSRRQRPLLYNVAESDIPLLRSRGFELTKWGE